MPSQLLHVLHGLAVLEALDARSRGLRGVSAIEGAEAHSIRGRKLREGSAIKGAEALVAKNQLLRAGPTMESSEPRAGPEMRGLSVRGLLSLGEAARILREPSFLPSFCLGCQGPDIFYHNQRTRPVGLEYGSLMHRRGYGAVTAVLLGEALERFRIGDGADRELAYALGFAMHAFLDRALHPYIISRSGSGGNAAETAARALYHIFLERLLDAAFLEECRAESWFQPLGSWFERADESKLLACSIRQAEILAEPARALAGSLVPLFSRALVSAYPERAGRDRLLEQRLGNAFSDAAYFFEHTDPRRARAQVSSAESGGMSLARARYLAAILYPSALPHDVDVLNTQGAPWLHPCEGEGVLHSSVRELFDSAVQNAAEAIACTWEMPGAENISACIGNASLSTNDAEGRTCQPRHFSPLPMEMLLEAQAAAWWDEFQDRMISALNLV